MSDSDAFMKADGGKVRFGLVPAWAQEQVARVFTYGAQKYSAQNWRKGTSWSRYIDALERHWSDWKQRKEMDAESGLHHLAHLVANAMILLELQRAGVGEDDRQESAGPAVHRSGHPEVLLRVDHAMRAIANSPYPPRISEVVDVLRHIRNAVPVSGGAP